MSFIEPPVFFNRINQDKTIIDLVSPAQSELYSQPFVYGRLALLKDNDDEDDEDGNDDEKEE